MTSRGALSTPWKLCAAGLMIVLGVVLCGRLSHPWTYNDDYNGAFWSQAARNLSQAGFFSTAGVPAPLYFGAPPIPSDMLYVHHPTLLPDMMLLDHALLGGSEAAARALPIFFSLLTAGLLWLFVARTSGYRYATFVLGFLVAAPMELHYGQMVNFEAPELFFLLAALCCFHRWLWHGTTANGAALLVCSAFAMWTDWQGYLLVMLLGPQLVFSRSRRNWGMAGGLVLLALFCGLAFLAQIHLASAGAWSELLAAFRQRSGHGDLAGGAFTFNQWLRTEFGYLTTLFHPVELVLSIARVVLAFLNRNRFTPRQAAPMHISAILFLIDAIYVCVLRNQSYIHDFAGYYFLVPLAVWAGYLVEQGLSAINRRRPRYSALSAATACVLIVALIASGIRSLANIDTQFCILGDDDKEPANLMPDVGRLIDRATPARSVVICNFDRYYSPLAYYARRTMVNDVRTYPEWQKAIADARPEPAAGIVWLGQPEAGDLIRNLPASETRKLTVDGVDFLLWTPHG